MTSVGDPRCVHGWLDGSVGWVLLDRPERMNAVTFTLAEQLLETVIGMADIARVILVRGAGGNFCAGGDFHEVERLLDEGPDALRRLFDMFGRACEAIGTIDVPVIAVVEGVATAGGFELAQACDIVLVREDAMLCDNHVNHGQVPGGGGSQRLPRLVGRQRALAHLLSGDRLTGLDAVAWGVAYRAWPADQFEAAVTSFAERLAQRSPTALARIKRLVRDGLAGSLEAGLAQERDAVMAHLTDADGRAGVRRFLSDRDGMMP